jgi:hypothetical protein
MNPVASTAAGYAVYGDTLLNPLSEDMKAGVTGATPFDVPILMPAIYFGGTLEGGLGHRLRRRLVKTSL